MPEWLVARIFIAILETSKILAGRWAHFGLSTSSTQRQACADPESFVRGAPTLFLVYEGKEDPNSSKNGPSLKWRFAGVSMMT